MHILQIANNYSNNTLYSKLFAALNKQGAVSSVYAPVKIGSTVQLTAPDAVSDVIVSPCFTQMDRVAFFPKQRKICADIEKKCDLLSIDVIHAHTLFSAGFAARQLSKIYNMPYIVAVRNTDVNVFFKYMLHLRNTGIDTMRYAEKIVFLSPAYQEYVLLRYVPAELRDELENKSVVIPNGISDLFFDNKFRPRLLQVGQPIHLLYVGDINQNKNLELTINAAKRLNTEGKQIKLTVIGSIKDERYRHMIQDNSFVSYYERSPQEQIIKHMRATDIFVMPSHTETFGLVYAEAMSQGMPVLYTKGQGFDKQFPEGTVGYAVSDKNAEELADKIELVIQNYEKLSENCINLVERFRWKKIATEYKELYCEALRKNKRV